MTKTDSDYAPLLKRSLLALDQMKAKLAAVENARNEPIAIIGMACRFPGGATIEEYWSLLRDGRDLVAEVPADRWDVEAFYDPDPDAIGKSYTRWGAFLPEVKAFDADFFGISRREAMNLDPQQRLLLELAWEGLENAGVAPAAMTGTRTAIHIGMASFDHVHLQAQSGAALNGGAYTASGWAPAMAAGRLAYIFGLHGPATTIDTACSSSIVAAHLGVQNLRNGEADFAIAAGVNVMLSPLGSILCSRARMMSFDGRCKTFDASADGYVRGEGCGLLVMKRLSDARRDGDRILAVIRGSAVNQDGRSSGLTAPNGQAQQDVIRAALENAGLSPADISYVEAHGTGTSLGDPIEMKALGAVFGDRPADRPLMVASAKTNIGHLEAASGIAGLIKTVLALQNRTLPRHLHFKTPNPLIPWDQYPVLAVPLETIPWNANGAPLRAGVSSFGFSGTNAHMVLEEAPAAPPSPQAAEPAATLLTLSAKNVTALTDLADSYAAALSAPDAPRLSEFAASAAIGRSHLAERLAVTAVDVAEAAGKLKAYVAGTMEPGVSKGWALSTGAPEIAFLFTGQGAQRPGMARELYDAEPVFRAAMDRCAEIAAPLLTRPLLSVIWGGPEDAALLDDTAFTQPAMFAVEYALSELWRSWGVEPGVVLGHSVGEYVAACLAKVFSLEDGLRLIAARGRLMSSLPRDGAMAAIFASEAAVRDFIGADSKHVTIAAVNGPESTVVSGLSEAVAAVLERAKANGLDGAPLKVSHAFHSALMDPILDEFEAIASGIAFSPPAIRLVSNLTGQFAGDEVATPAYWRQHLREAVRFSDSLRTLYDDAYRVFIEVGPAPVLLGMGQRCNLGDDAVWLASLRNKRADRASMLDSLGQLYVRGLKPTWKGLFGDPAHIRRHAPVPTYPFQRERYWSDTQGHGAGSGARLTPTRTGHPLLGGVVASPLNIYQVELDLAVQPWLGDHRILDFTPFPAAGFMELVIAAGREALGYDCALRDLTIDEALMLPPEGAVTVQVIVTPEREMHRVQVFSKAAVADAWRLHVSGVLTRKLEAPAKEAAGLAFEVGEAMTSENAASYYGRLAATGTQYGPTFRGITSLVRDQRRVFGQIQLSAPAAREAGRYQVHPGLLDSCIQLVGAVLLDDEDEPTYLPVGVDRYDLFRPGVSGGKCFVSVDAAPDGSSLTSDFVFLASDGAVVAHLAGLRLRRVTRSGLSRVADAGADVQKTFELAWEVSAPPAQAAEIDHWLILADADDLGDALAGKLRKTGAVVSVVKRGDAYAETMNGWAIDPADAAQWSRMFTAAADRGGRPVSGVAALWAVDARQTSEAADDIEAGHLRVLERMLHMSRAVGDASVRLWIVTRGSQAVDGSVPDLVQAPAWALAGVVAAEYPALKVVRIDLDPDPRTGEIDLLVQTLRGGGAEDRIALRRETRYVARLRPFTSDSSNLSQEKPVGPQRRTVRLQADATYAVTGGLGGLGLATAQWMVREGARHLVLFGRRAPSATAQAQIAELRAVGVEVLVAKVDVSNFDELSSVLSEVQASMPPLRGLIHAAGVIDDGMLAELTMERFASVMAAKVRGALNLHALTRGAPLDFFVLFSSGAALLGSPGQGNYAAANGFLDALAHVREAQGLPGLSINWGSWAEVGMAAGVDEQHRRRWSAAGLAMISPAEGVQMLQDAIYSGERPQVAAIPLIRSKTLKGLSPFFSEITPAEADARNPDIAPGEMLRRLANEAPDGRAALMTEFLSALLVRILALNSASKFDPRRSIVEMGMDSLMAMELRNRLLATLNVRLSVSDLLKGPSAQELSAIVLRTVDLPDAAPSPDEGDREVVLL
jgi:acyl transferase domain-containing protein